MAGKRNSFCYLVEVLNWEKYNPNEKVNWFRCEAGIVRHPSYTNLSHGAKLGVLWLLCRRAETGPNRIANDNQGLLKDALSNPQGSLKEQRSVLQVSPKEFSSATHVKLQSVLRVLEELKNAGWIQLHNAEPSRVDINNNIISVLKTRNETERDVTIGSPEEPNGASKPEAGQLTMDNPPVVAAAPPATFEKPKKAKKPEPSPEIKELRHRTWAAYEAAYLKVWKKSPVRNAPVNAQIAKLVERLGKDAPAVIEFYCKHRKGFYVQACHPVSLCLRDAEGLHTQWANQRPITDATMKQFQTQEHYNEQLGKIERGEL